MWWAKWVAGGREHLVYTVNVGRMESSWDWRNRLTPALIKGGKEILDKGGVTIDVTPDGRGGSAKVGRFTVVAKGLPITYAQSFERFPRPGHPVTCTCAAFAKGNRKCKHVAAFLLAWERDVSSFSFAEPGDIYRERMDKETSKRTGSRLAPLFSDLDEIEGRMFHPWLALNVVSASDEEIEGASDIIKGGRAGEPVYALEQDLLREQRLAVTLPFEDGAKARASVTPAKASVDLDFSCTCAAAGALGRYSFKLCRHEVVALHRLWEYVVTHDPGDTTNADGLQLMRTMRQMHAAALGADAGAGVGASRERFRLAPQLSVSSWGGEVTFRLELSSGRTFALRNLQNFLDALDGKGTLSISQKSHVDFSGLEIDPGSERWLRFIRLNMKTMRRINAMIDNSHSGYYASKHPASFGYKSYVPVEYETADAFYDLAQGSDLETADGASRVHVGPVDTPVHLDVRIERDGEGRPLEAHVTGDVPHVWEGYVYHYLVLDNAIIRIPAEERDGLLGLFATRRAGRLEANVGRKYVETFLGETLPLLMRNRVLDVTCS